MILTQAQTEGLRKSRGKLKVVTYQIEKQNSNSFNWGFFVGLFLSSAFWATVIYNVI